MEKVLMNVHEVAEYLKVSYHTIYQWKCYEKIPYIKLGGKLLFEKEAINNFIATNSCVLV